MLGFSLLGWVSFMPSSAPEWIMNVALVVCRSQTGIQVLFYLAVACHVAEAMLCWLRITRYNMRMKRYITTVDTDITTNNTNNCTSSDASSSTIVSSGGGTSGAQQSRICVHNGICCSRIDHILWTAQTFLLGYPSLRHVIHYTRR